MLLIILIILLVILLLRPKYNNPRILEGVLTDDDCEYIKSKAEPELKVSTVSDDRNIDYHVRKSETAWLGFDDERIHDIAHRCLKHVGMEDCDNCESLQVLRYKPGGFYNPHQDANMEHANKRKYTFILALNDKYEGGKTSFPVLNKSYRLHKGDALLFDTLDTWGRVNKKALHGGEPVESGEKWICNLWVREYKYHP
jgi:hypothetical protein